MKATLKLEDGTEVEFTLTKEQEEQLCNVKKNEFEIEYGNYSYIANSRGETYKISTCNELIKQGTVRKTQELAEKNINEMRARNKLAELRDWLEPEFEFKKELYENKWYLCYDFKHTHKFVTRFSQGEDTIGCVYMSKQTAEKICNALNDGNIPELAEVLKKGIV